MDSYFIIPTLLIIKLITKIFLKIDVGPTFTLILVYVSKRKKKT